MHRLGVTRMPPNLVFFAIHAAITPFLLCPQLLIRL
jgi:hypothetical protein